MCYMCAERLALSTLPRLQFSIITLIVCVIAACAITLAFLSLRWPVEHDLPIMLYEGYLMDEWGLVPYRDFFEMNPPGTMLLNVGIHRLTGGAPVPCRVIDLILLAAISGFTYRIFRRIDGPGGIVAASCFALVYLGGGSSQSLQREYICLVPLSLSAAAVFTGPPSGRGALWVAPLIGFLAGLAATIKPPVVLCWVPLGVYWTWSSRECAQVGEKQFPAAIVKRVILGGIGFLAPLAAVAAWLFVKGGLPRYVEILSEYYPLYSRIEGDAFVPVPGLASFLLRYFEKPVRLVAAFPFVAMAFIGAMNAITVKDRSVVARMVTIAAMAVFALIYVPVGGKFWFYHCIPLWYAMSLLTGFALCAAPSSPGKLSVGHITVVFVAILSALPYGTLRYEYAMARTGLVHIVKDGRVDAITEYLERQTGSSTTIMPLDVTSGAIHAMYRSRRPLYGGFIYNLHFYHDTDHPFVKALREQLVSRFTDTAPEVIVSCESWRPHGSGCSAEFPKLDLLMKERYAVAVEGNGFKILRRVGP